MRAILTKANMLKLGHSAKATYLSITLIFGRLRIGEGQSTGLSACPKLGLCIGLICGDLTANRRMLNLPIKNSVSSGELSELMVLNSGELA